MNDQEVIADDRDIVLDKYGREVVVDQREATYEDGLAVKRQVSEGNLSFRTGKYNETRNGNKVEVERWVDK